MTTKMARRTSATALVDGMGLTVKFRSVSEAEHSGGVRSLEAFLTRAHVILRALHKRFERKERHP